jgi:hypothetical protein
MCREREVGRGWKERLSYPAAFLFSFCVERERERACGGKQSNRVKQKWFYLLWWLMCVEAAICRKEVRGDELLS